MKLELDDVRDGEHLLSYHLGVIAVVEVLAGTVDADGAPDPAVLGDDGGRDLQNFVLDVGECSEAYDAVVFYNFHRPDEVDEDTRAAVDALRRRGQGIVVLHHGLLAFPEWDLWSDVCGIVDRDFDFFPERTVDVEVADDAHPVTAGLEGWQMTDETYTMDEPDDDSRVLLTVDHPESMEAVAWTRESGDARVFCYQSGHGANAFTNPQFRRVLGDGIRWAAGRPVRQEVAE